jgi:AraC-like DNA-binding protein
MPSNRQIVLLLDTTNPHQRKIAQGVATYAHQQGNWSIEVVQDPCENLPYLMYDPLESSINSGKWLAEIQRVQIGHVRQLMAATDLPLNRVAVQSGFRYLQQMIAAFRRHTGQTPGEYRIRSRHGIAGGTRHGQT